MNPTERARRRETRLEWQVVVNSYPCHRCGVRPGRSCRTDMGHIAAAPHAERSRTAAARGWAFADAPPRCYQCHRPLEDDLATPAFCRRCRHE